MKLTSKLISLLHRVFDPDPERFLALRINYAGDSMSWAVSDAVLTTTVRGGIGHGLTIDLTAYTLRELVSFIAAQPGYSVPSAIRGASLSLSARVLIDGAGDQAASNGDHLYGYASLLWVFMEPAAVELQAAKAQIPNAIRQMSITTAEQDWLDELGGYYGIPRLQGELDASYGPRIISEVVRPRSNNIAIEKAISYYTGQSTKVVDVTVYGDPFPIYNGAINRDGTYQFQQQTPPLYGLFDVQYGYDLLSNADPTQFADVVRGIINRIRAAGTHLRALSLQGRSILDDAAGPSSEAMTLAVQSSLDDQLDAPSDSDMVIAALLDAQVDQLDEPAESPYGFVFYDTRYNSLRTRNGTVTYAGGSTGKLWDDQVGGMSWVGGWDSRPWLA